MRQGPNGRRSRGRPNRKQHGGPSRPNNFDSAGPDGRIRGNAHQVYEKYVALARDAMSAGDRVAAEAFYQHAEHYFRIVNSSTDPELADRRQPRGESLGREGNGLDGNGPEAEAGGPNGRDQRPRGQNVQEPGGRDIGEPGPNGRESRGEASWAQGGGEPHRAHRGSEAPEAEKRPARAADTSGSGDGAAQATPPRGPQEDREGLDRIIGQDRRAPRRRPPQRAPRVQGAVAEDSAPGPREQARSEHSDQRQVPGDAPGAVSEIAESDAPNVEKPDNEPVGA